MNNCSQGGAVECDTVQIIEPKSDFLVDTGGTASDMDERGSVVLTTGQDHAIVYFLVPKLNNNYHFEYLYVDAEGIPHPGTVIPIPTIRQTAGFAIRFAGTPPPAPAGTNYVLYWRVTIVTTTDLVQTDAPEDIYLVMPQTNFMYVVFANPRSGVNYGFSELRVENLTDPLETQTPIHVQVCLKTTTEFVLGVNPIPPTSNYFLKVRTP